MYAKAFSPEPRGDCRMVKHSTLPLSQQRDPCRRLWAWKGCQPATLHPRQKMQSMQGIQPSERGSLLSPTALCPQTLCMLVLFVPSVIIRRYFQGGGNHPDHPSTNNSPLNRPGVEEEHAKKVVGAICHGPPAQRRQSQHSTLSAGPYGSTGLLLLSTGASSPPTQNSI